MRDPRESKRQSDILEPPAASELEGLREAYRRRRRRVRIATPLVMAAGLVAMFSATAVSVLWFDQGVVLWPFWLSMAALLAVFASWTRDLRDLRVRIHTLLQPVTVASSIMHDTVSKVVFGGALMGASILPWMAFGLVLSIPLYKALKPLMLVTTWWWIAIPLSWVAEAAFITFLVTPSTAPRPVDAGSPRLERMLAPVHRLLSPKLPRPGMDEEELGQVLLGWLWPSKQILTLSWRQGVVASLIAYGNALLERGDPRALSLFAGAARVLPTDPQVWEALANGVRPVDPELAEAYQRFARSEAPGGPMVRPSGASHARQHERRADVEADRGAHAAQPLGAAPGWPLSAARIHRVDLDDGWVAYTHRRFAWVHLVIMLLSYVGMARLWTQLSEANLVSNDVLGMTLIIVVLAAMVVAFPSYSATRIRLHRAGVHIGPFSHRKEAFTDEALTAGRTPIPVLIDLQRVPTHELAFSDILEVDLDGDALRFVTSTETLRVPLGATAPPDCMELVRRIRASWERYQDGVVQTDLEAESERAPFQQGQPQRD